MERSEFMCKMKDLLNECGFSENNENEYLKESKSQVVVASMMVNGTPMQQVADVIVKMTIKFMGEGALSDDSNEEYFELLHIELEKNGGYSELNESFYYNEDDLNRLKSYCETFFK